MPNKTIEELLKKFDDQFGTDGPDKNSDSIGRSAGCDDCCKNIEIRGEHRDFVTASLQEVYEAGYKEGARRGCRFCFSTDNR